MKYTPATSGGFGIIVRVTISSRVFPLLAAFLFAISIWLATLVLKQNLWNSDFRVFYTSSILLRTNPKLLYDYDAQEKLQTQFFYTPQATDHDILSLVNPPPVLFLYLPFSFLSPVIGHHLFAFFSLILLFISCQVIFRSIGKKWTRNQKILFVLFALSFTPTYVSLALGQNSTLTLLLFSLAYYAMEQKHEKISGILLGILAYKPQLLLFPLFVSFKRISFWTGFFLGVLLILFISLVILPSFIPIFLHQLLSYGSSTLPEQGTALMLSWRGFFTEVQFFLPSLSVQSFTLFFSTLTILWTIVYRKKLSFFSMIPLLLLSAFHIHIHDGLLLLLPIAFLWSTSSQQIRYFLAWIWLCFFFSYFSPFFPYPFVFFPHITLILLSWVCIKKDNRI